MSSSRASRGRPLVRVRAPLPGEFYFTPTSAKALIKDRLVRSLYKRGFVVSRRGPSVAEQFSPDELEVFRRVAEYTMTPPERVATLIDAVTYVSRHQIAGAIAECGVWRGGSMMAAALTLTHLHDERDLFLFDTFEGMTPPTEKDVDFKGVGQSLPSERAHWPGLEAVQAALHSTGYDRSRLHFVKGPVEQTLPAHAPESIALLRLDTDWYESTKHELETLYPRLAPGGVLLVDDYGHYRGAREAVDEYFGGHGPLLARTDYAARVAIKLAVS